MVHAAWKSVNNRFSTPQPEFVKILLPSVNPASTTLQRERTAICWGRTASSSTTGSSAPSAKPTTPTTMAAALLAEDPTPSFPAEPALTDSTLTWMEFAPRSIINATNTVLKQGFALLAYQKLSLLMEFAVPRASQSKEKFAYRLEVGVPKPLKIFKVPLMFRFWKVSFSNIVEMSIQKSKDVVAVSQEEILWQGPIYVLDLCIIQHI